MRIIPRPWVLVPLVPWLAACHRPLGSDPTNDGEPMLPVAAAAGPSVAAAPKPADVAEPSLSDPHRVVFADRTSQGYLLLVDTATATTPTREQLKAIATRAMPAATRAVELKLLLQLIDTEPLAVDPKLADSLSYAPGTPRETTDLLGLLVELLPLREGGADLVSTELLTDPILTRELTLAERASLAGKRTALLLRADYRNRYSVRGLRLLQELVIAVAREYHALIHDPDTNETMGIDAFTRRGLRPSMTNIADQIAVVPFSDPRHGAGFVRLSTRGMRRFGSVDLELDGLPRDGALLQAATDLLYGLSYKLVRLGEFDVSGYAVELDELVTVTRDDVASAYPDEGRSLPACEACEQSVDVHLVERPRQDHDPREHVVARVVAPRLESDASDYDHRAWARKAASAFVPNGQANP